MVDRQRILAQRRRKILLEVETAERIKERGLHPLDVLDDMFHAMVVLRKAALEKEHPGATGAEIVRMMQLEEEAARRYKHRPVN